MNFKEDGPQYHTPVFPLQVDKDGDIVDANGWLVFCGVYDVWPDVDSVTRNLCDMLNAAQPFYLKCTGCGTLENVCLEQQDTMYVTDLPWGHPKNPNAPIPLCPACAEDAKEYWRERWAEVYGGYM